VCLVGGGDHGSLRVAAGGSRHGELNPNLSTEKPQREPNQASQITEPQDKKRPETYKIVPNQGAHGVPIQQPNRLTEYPMLIRYAQYN
jgi:hypothetical protein